MTVFRSGYLVAAVLSVGLLAGCGGGASKTPESFENFTAEEIYKRGEYELENSGKPKDAVKYFTEVERLYPYSDWAKRALIMQAYSYHRARDYEEARASAQRFIDTYPGDEDAAYAKYLLALSYYDQIDEVGRDQGLTFQALQALRAVIEEYPDSEYARSAILKFDLAFDHLAGKEMEIGRFYQNSGQMIAARIRFQTVVDKYQTTSHTAEALYRLTETSLVLGIPEEAKKYAAVLGANYPGSEWYQRAYKLMSKSAPDAQAS